jgi:transposase
MGGKSPLERFHVPRQSYPSDLTDAEWAVLAPLIPFPRPGGRPPIHERRELVNAMRYVLRGGIAWRALPHDLPPWQTVYHYFRRWRIDGTWERANTSLREQVRVRAGRAAAPTAAILDSQSVRPTEKGGCAATMAPKN